MTLNSVTKQGRLTVYRATIARTSPPNRATELAPTMTAGLLGTEAPVELVLEADVVRVTAVVERLPPVGADVMVGFAPVVTVVLVLERVLLDSLALLALLLEDNDELVAAVALMLKGNEYWKIVASESRVMRRPYVASFPMVLSTAQEYWPAALSTFSVEGG